VDEEAEDHNRRARGDGDVSSVWTEVLDSGVRTTGHLAGRKNILLRRWWWWWYGPWTLADGCESIWQQTLGAFNQIAVFDQVFDTFPSVYIYIYDLECLWGIIYGVR